MLQLKLETKLRYLATARLEKSAGFIHSILFMGQLGMLAYDLK